MGINFDYDELVKRAYESLKDLGFGVNQNEIKNMVDKMNEILGINKQNDVVANSTAFASDKSIRHNVVVDSESTNTCYRTSTDNELFKLEIVIPGESVDNFSVRFNSKDLTLTVVRKTPVSNLPWYAGCKDKIVVNLPSNIKADTLTKKSENGLLVITGKIVQQKDFEREI